MVLKERIRLAGSSALARFRRTAEHKPLAKATYAELFFDLVFIFCMRSILPIITDVEAATVDWYMYYTFAFTFVLMLQIWFNSTIFMNRFGTGGPADIAYLFTTMFLLFVMTQAISTGWEHYAIYNVCWILTIVNTMAHWTIRYKRIANPSPAMVKDAKLVLGSLGIQALLIALSHLFPHNPAQVVCLIGLLFGFTFWFTGTEERLNHENREHLSERCALLMVLTFGETLIGYAYLMTTDLNLFSPIMYFLLIVGMFLVYLNEITNLLDLGTLRSGTGFMAISAWLTFCVANVTAGFEMSLRGMRLMFMDGGFYFGLSVVVFLLSLMLFTPMNKDKHPPFWWMNARVAACLLVLAQTSVISHEAKKLLTSVLAGDMSHVVVGEEFAGAMMVVSVVAVYAVLAIDRLVLRRLKRKAAAEVAAAGERAAHGAGAEVASVGDANEAGEELL